ncbi:MAG: YebC/PmpR family DNA-binding transcriptional regulator [Deltaproteobacteria bacterium]|nr:YebC/PmpR family DNA-binding transcriptional regulator [Deltaproteobacteria bacterium]
MSGHSKWSTIKHKKGAADAKRGKIFTKVIREITVAARMGGGDVTGNPRLKAAVSLAKSVNMPSDNVQKAINKGIGADKSVNYENIVYEGYGPGNIALIVDCLTDNRNRTISSIRSIFNKNNGNLGTSNSVLYMFERKGLIEVEKSKIDEDSLTEHILEAGGEDIDSSDEEIFEITTKPEDISQIVDYLEEKSIPVSKSQVSLIPANSIMVDDLQLARQILNFIDILEDDDDVQHVYSNLDLSQEILDQL